MRSWRLILGSLLVAVCALSSGQTWKVAWSAYYDPRGTTEEKPRAITPAKDGGAYGLTYMGGWQLVKVDQNGVRQWSSLLGFDNIFESDMSKRTMKVAEGTNGVFVAATVDRLYPLGSAIAVAKYDSSGQRLFLQYFGTQPGYSLNQLVLGANDDVFLHCTSNAGNPQDVVVKFDTTGKQVWLKRIPFVSNVGAGEPAIPMRTDGQGNLFVGGLNDNNNGPWLMKFTPDGQVAWTYTAANEGAISAFVVGPDGSVYLPDRGLRKILSDGTVAWTFQLPGYGFGIPIADPLGATYVCADTYPSGGPPFPVAKVSAQGTLVWLKSIRSGAALDGFVDSSGNLNLVESLSPPYVQPEKVEQFDGNGNPLWASGSGLTGTFSSLAVGFTTGGFAWSAGDAGEQFCAMSRLTSAGAVRWSNYSITNDHSSAIRMLSSTSPSGTTYFAGHSHNLPANKLWMGAIDTNGHILFARESGASPPVAVLALASGGALYSFSDSLKKFDSAGNQVWSVNMPGPQWMTIDGSGSIFCLDGIAVTKLTGAGVQVWKRTLPSDVVHGDALCLDTVGNVIVGYDGTSGVLGVCKLNGAGTVQWHNTFPKTYITDYVVKVAANSANTIFLTYDHYTAGTTYGAVQQFSSSGTLGWQVDLGANFNSPTNDSVLAPTGVLYAVGQTYTGSITEMVIFAVNTANGSIQWVKTPNVGQHSSANKVFLDNKGHVVITGWRYDPNTAYDYVVVGMSPAGNIDATAAFDSGAKLAEMEDGLGVDSSGNAYIAGRVIGPSNTYNFNVVKYLPPLLDDATVTQTVNTKMLAGQTYLVTIGVKDIGLNSWTAAAGYKLDCLEPTTWGISSVPLLSTETVLPGDTKQFSANVKAPTTPGIYPLQWRMENTGKLFGDPSQLINVTVIAQTNFGAFVVQNVPSTMICGQSYPVSLQYNNTGTNTWTTSGQYNLQSAGPYDNTYWGSTRIPLINSSVAPGATGTFAKTIIAPAIAGTYNFQWQPIQDSIGVNFSTLSPGVPITVTKATDAARYLSRTGATSVGAGQDFYVQNSMMNVGINTWTPGGGYAMMSLGPTGNTVFGTSKLYMPTGSSIAAGFSVTYTGLCTSPVIPGSYTMQWQCARNGVLFGDKSPLLTITVNPSLDDSQYISETPLPSSIGPSSTFNVTMTMKNLGSATWGSGYALVPIGSNNFGMASIASATVAPNANGTFAATFTTPSTPGVYTFQWRMAHNGVKFGQATASASILVAADASIYVTRVGPTTVYAGQDFWVQYTMKNVGSNTWTSAAGYTMMTVNPDNNTTWTVNRAYMPAGSSIPTNSQATFSALCTAPIVAKSYTMQWQMNRAGTPFGDKAPSTFMNVVQGPDNAIYVSQANVATKILHGTPFDATITMQNVGTASWDSSYSLVPVGQSFGIASINAAFTLPNGQCSFTATFTAPPTAGTYIFQMRMAHNSTKFGQLTPKFTVVVT